MVYPSGSCKVSITLFDAYTYCLKLSDQDISFRFASPSIPKSGHQQIQRKASREPSFMHEPLGLPNIFALESKTNCLLNSYVI